MRRTLLVVAAAVVALAVVAGVIVATRGDDGVALGDHGLVVADVGSRCHTLEAFTDDLWVVARGHRREPLIPPEWRGRQIEARLVLDGDGDATWVAGHLTAADGSRVAVRAVRRGDGSAAVHADCPAWPPGR